MPHEKIIGVIVLAFTHALLNISFSIFPFAKLFTQVSSAPGNENINITVKYALYSQIGFLLVFRIAVPPYATLLLLLISSSSGLSVFIISIATFSSPFCSASFSAWSRSVLVAEILVNGECLATIFSKISLAS